MTSNTFYTAAATSDIADQVEKAVRKAVSARSDEQVKRLKATINRIAELNERGLLLKQEYKSSSAADFKRYYLAK